MKKYMEKHRQFLLYALFGAGTTVINILTYHFLYDILNVSNTAGNAAAWIISVLFAYITNRCFVFRVRANGLTDILLESLRFFGCRGLTGLLDIAVMFIAVDILLLPALPMKLCSNILVILLNFAASKLFIFRKKVSGGFS